MDTMAQVEETAPMITPDELRKELSSTAFAFRGYNVTNLGHSPELLAVDAYRPIFETYLKRGAAICSEVSGQSVDLIKRIENREETSLETYDEAIAMIVAVELAHLDILRDIFDIDLKQGAISYGFSLGEIAALIASGMIDLEEALRIPLSMSRDCASLAPDVTLGVLFSRRGELSYEKVSLLCQDINVEGNGVIGVSAILAPNSLLLIGQGDTLDRLSDRRKEISDERVFLRRNDNKWPPLHTPLVWQHNIPNRSMQMMHQMPILADAPQPKIFSLVTGEANYTKHNLREIIGQWVDHPQRLWDAVLHTTSEGIEHIIHVGPQPNIIPATFDRLAGNVASQTKESVSIRALSGIVNRPWLTSLLPRRASLLRAAQLTHIKLEEWLLEYAPS